MEITKNEIKDLKKYYKYVYGCIKCHTVYGSDKEEKIKLCPNCDPYFKKK